MKKNVFSLAVVIPLENKIEYIAHSQFSLIKYISNLTPRSPPPALKYPHVDGSHQIVMLNEG